MYRGGTEPTLTPNQQDSMDIKNNVDSLAKEKKSYLLEIPIKQCLKKSVPSESVSMNECVAS